MTTSDKDVYEAKALAQYFIVESTKLSSHPAIAIMALLEAAAAIETTAVIPGSAEKVKQETLNYYSKVFDRMLADRYRKHVDRQNQDPIS